MKKILFTFLFVLAIVPAAFAATGSMPGPVCKTDAGLYCCENATCSDLSQSQYREYKSIKGTVYSNIETREHFNGFVKLEYKPNDPTKPSKTFFIDGSFGFGIPKDAPGIITFTAWKNNKANPEYQVVRVSTDEFRDYGKDILMQKATPTTVTNTNTSTETGASSGTTGGNGETKPYSGYVYADYQKSRPLSGVLVTDLNGGATTTTNSNGQFKLNCLYTTIVNQSVAEEQINKLNISDAKKRELIKNIPSESRKKCLFTLSMPNQDPKLVYVYENETRNVHIYEIASSGTRSGPTRSSSTSTTSGTSAQSGTTNGTASSGTNDSTNTTTNKITVSGNIKDENGKVALGVAVTQQGTTNGTVVDADGNFSLKVDPGSVVEISGLGYETRTFQTSTSDMSVGNIKIKEENVLLDKTWVKDDDKCKQESTKRELNAIETYWFELDETIDYSQDDAKRRATELNYVGGLSSTPNNRKICIPKKCIDNYTLEYPESKDAKCVKCEKTRVPFARTTKVENNTCVPDGCVNGFVRVGAQCLVNCDTLAIRNKLNAKQVARKTRQPNSERPDGDYSSFCYATACDKTKSYSEGNGENTICKSNVGISCIGPMKEVEPNATVAKFDGNGLCVLDSCDPAYNAVETTTSKKCGESVIPGLRCSGKCEIAADKECDFNGNSSYVKSTKGKTDKNDICVPTCFENYNAKLNGDQYECVFDSNKCPSRLSSSYPDAQRLEITADKTGYWDANGNILKCDIKECKDRQKTQSEDRQSCVAKCTEAAANDLKNTGHALTTTTDRNGNCIISECQCGYTLNKNTKECDKWNPAPKCDKRTNPVLPENAKTAHMACDTSAKPEEQTYCSIDECINSLYEKKNSGNRQNAVCEAIKPDCQVTDGGKYASEAGKWELDKSGNKICVPKIVRSVEDYQNEIAELSDNAAAMHENETSLKNRIIGAVGIGATGIGGTMLGAAISETAADAAAERDMAAYLQSMHCEYGNGHNVNGGETGVELPGGNDMIALYTEYAQLANDLKIRKQALGIRPGIESEVVIDKSQTDLYEYDNNGITGGVYASIARALLDPEGEDAAMWAAQKEKTKNTLVAGAITAGVGAVGSAVANAIVNHKNPKKSDEIKRRYEGMKKPFQDLQQSFSEKPKKQCKDFYPGSTGSDLNNCTCLDSNSYLTKNGCEACGSGLIVNDTKDGCKCQNPKQTKMADGTCKDSAPDCDLTNLVNPNECRCISGATHGNDNVCNCDTSAGYIEQENTCVCDTNRGYAPNTDGTCACDTSKGFTQKSDGTCGKEQGSGDQIARANIPADSLFESGKADIKPDAKPKLDAFITKAKGSNIDLNNPNEYCLVIVGKTDHQGFKSTSMYYKNGGNQKLSEDRANAVKDYIKAPFNENAIRTVGVAATDCPTPKKGESKANQECRRVDIIMLAGSCSENFNKANWITSVAKAQEAIDLIKNTLNK